MTASLFAFVQKQAWLNTTPDPPERGQKQDKEVTHQQQLEAKYENAEWVQELIDSPQLPIECELWASSFQGFHDGAADLPYQLAHIWVYLLEVGPVGSNGMGPTAITFTEIKAWMDATGIPLSYWEVSLLRRCSLVWVSAQYEAKQPNAIPPWNIGDSKISAKSLADRRKSVADRLKSLGS